MASTSEEMNSQSIILEDLIGFFNIAGVQSNSASQARERNKHDRVPQPNRKKPQALTTEQFDNNMADEYELF